VRELLGSATDFAVLVNPTNPTLAESNSKAVQQAALNMGIRVHTVKAGTEAELEAAFPRLNQLGVGGLVIAIDSFFTARREKLGALALRHRIAAIYQSRDFAEAGGVMSYGGSLNDGYRLVGLYTGRILRGENPADLPVQQPTKAELVVNLKAINALGLTAAPSLLARADEVLE
jgi:putative tryptophan/tyrosine transport system substrate-binding protein